MRVMVGTEVVHVKLVCTAKSDPPAPGDYKGRGYFREYDVVLPNGTVIGTVTGSMTQTYSNRLGRTLVGYRTWAGYPNGGVGAVMTRREAVEDVVRCWLQREGQD